MNHTERFEFKTADGMDRPTIWFAVNGKEVIVHALHLYEILWDCYREQEFSEGITARFQIFPDEVCGYFHGRESGDFYVEYERSSFVDSAVIALKDMCEAIMTDEESYGQYGMKKDDAERMMKGLNEMIIPGNYSQIFEADVNVERFDFEFTGPYSGFMEYRTSIGDRECWNRFSSWSNDFNRIRLALETYVTGGESCELSLDYDTSPTVIRVQNRNIFWNHDTVAKVTVVPNEFTKGAIEFGWCRPRQMVRSLYLGMLDICMTESDWPEREDEGTWAELRLAIYNKLQSCVVEDYIMGETEDSDTFRPRQRVIHSVREMFDDYESLKLRLDSVKI